MPGTGGTTGVIRREEQIAGVADRPGLLASCPAHGCALLPVAHRREADPIGDVGASGFTR